MIQVIKNMDRAIYDAFVADHQGTIYQSSPWAQVKNNWQSQRIGVYEGDQLIGVALMLLRSLPMTPFKLAYMPRGPICGDDQLSTFEKVLNACKDVAKQERAFTLKFDPQISREAGQDMKDLVEEQGGKHGGYNKGIVYNQPNFLMITDMGDDQESLFERFPSKIRTQIRKGNQAGVHVYQAGLDEVSTFEALMEITAQRDDFGKRDEAYFTRLLETLGDNAQLYLVKLDVQESLDAKLNDQENLLKDKTDVEAKLAQMQDPSVKKADKLRNQLVELETRLTKAESMIEDLRSWLEQGQSQVALSGALMAYFGDTAYYLYAASSNDFRDLMPNYLMIWTIMTEAMATGYRYFDFGGVSGYTTEDNQDDPLRGLYEFKKNFASELLETIGEFDIVTNPWVNATFDTLMHWRKTLLKRGNH